MKTTAVWLSRHRYPADLRDRLPDVDIVRARGWTPQAARRAEA